MNRRSWLVGAMLAALSLLPPAWADSVGFNDLVQRAEKGDTNAANTLGIMYATGRGVQQDYLQAKEWWEKAAARHHGGAMTNIGILYFRGQGVGQDDKAAFEWFSKSAELNVPSGQYWVGYMYKHGFGVAKDPDKAKRYFLLSAGQGYRPAKNEIAEMELGPTSQGGGK